MLTQKTCSASKSRIPTVLTIRLRLVLRADSETTPMFWTCTGSIRMTPASAAPLSCSSLYLGTSFMPIGDTPGSSEIYVGSMGA